VEILVINSTDPTTKATERVHCCNTTMQYQGGDQKTAKGLRKMIQLY